MSDFNFKNYFRESIENDRSMQFYFQKCINCILIAASNKGIEFEAYYQGKWEKEYQDPVFFNEAYFGDFPRQKLYVCLAALIDHEIYNYFREMYEVAELPLPDREKIAIMIKNLKKHGTKF